MNILSINTILIINEIGKWKAILLKDLFDCLGEKKTYSNFCIKIRGLEKADLVKGVFERKRGKYLTLTEKGAGLSIYPYTDYESSESITHDLICTATIRNILGFKLFSSGSAYDWVDSIIVPDGVIHGKSHGHDYTMALEVELHQKAQVRVVEKFAKYLNEAAFDNVLYITHKKNIFDAYKKILTGMNSRIQSKIVLSFDPTLGLSSHDYINAIYWFNGKIRSFDYLFGRK